MVRKVFSLFLHGASYFKTALVIEPIQSSWQHAAGSWQPAG
jgi:hypothetical protein